MLPLYDRRGNRLGFPACRPVGLSPAFLKFHFLGDNKKKPESRSESEKLSRRKRPPGLCIPAPLIRLFNFALALFLFPVLDNLAHGIKRLPQAGFGHFRISLRHDKRFMA
jgi:hypothetical protein